MRIRDLAELLALGAIWGSSFILMKDAVPEFGVIALVEFRAVAATLCLLPLVWLRKQMSDLKDFWPQLLFIGAINTALPFCLFNYAVSYLDAGLAAILNATAPMFGVVIAWLYLKEKIGMPAIAGLGVGFVGVILISSDPTTSEGASTLPILAALGATFCYGVAASYIKKHLSATKPFALAAGSQIFAAILLLPFALMHLPSQMPSSDAWFSALILGFLCTGLAYVMYFNLITNVGASKAITVGYLVPLFGLFWGFIILDERLSEQQILGSVAVMLGVLLATNAFKLLKRSQREKKQA